MLLSQEEKVKFVRDLLGSITDKLVEDIESGRVPEHWNGIELRWLIAERANNATVGKQNGVVYRNYRNDVLVNDL